MLAYLLASAIPMPGAFIWLSSQSFSIVVQPRMPGDDVTSLVTLRQNLVILRQIVMLSLGKFLSGDLARFIVQSSELWTSAWTERGNCQPAW